MIRSTLMRYRSHLLTTVLLLASPLTAHALDFEYIKIADTSTTIPSAGGTFTGFTAPAINGYTVAFSGSQAGYSGIFTSAGGILTKTVDTNTLIPAGTGTFTGFSGFSLDNNQVAFTGSGNSQQGIYTTNPTGLARAVDLTTAIPSGTGNFTSFSAPSLSSGNVAFVGNGVNQQGVYTNANTGSYHVIADTNTAIPSGTGNFTLGSFSSASINFSDVAFRGGGSSSQAGVYDTINGLHRIADKTVAVPGGAGNFTDFSTINLSFGSDAFSNGSATVTGIYTNNGGPLSVAADTNTPIPGGNGNFTSFGPASHFSYDVAFIGNGSGGQVGLYTTYGGTVTPVIAKGNVLDGKTVANVSAGSTQSINNGNFVFIATFTDGSTGVYAAQQNYNYASDVSGNWDNASNWSFGLAPRLDLYTYIHPDFGVVVTGPAVATVIRGLDINANNNGVAELRLQPGAQLSVNEFTNIGGQGRLNVNGGTFFGNYGIYNYGGFVDLNGGQISGGDINNYGTVTANGTIGSHVENNGTFQAINATSRFTNSVNSYQEFQIINTQIQFDQQFNNIENDGNNQFGRIDVRNSIIQFTIGLDNTGQFNVSFGTTDIFGPVTNDTGGQVIISGNSNVTFYDRLIHNGSTFRISPGSTAIFFGLVSGAGDFTGGGTKIFEGGYSPGNSPAAVSLDGPVTFDTSNSLNIEIGGPNPGTGFDQVNVAGNLNLGGTLNVTLYNGYLPAVGATFQIVNFTSSTGAFFALPSSNLNGALRTNWTTNQTPTGISVTFQSAFYDLQNGTYSQNLNVNGIPLIKSTTSTATLTGLYSANGPVTINAGKLVFASTSAARQTPAVLLNMQSLSLASTTVLDITNHDLIIGNASVASVATQILNGMGSGNVTPAITSSAAKGTGTTFIIPVNADSFLGNGSAGSAIGKVFDGTTITQPSSVIVKYTYFGDLNLDGLVNAADFNIFKSHLGQTSPGASDISTSWLMGDVNLDGIINGLDYATMIGNFSAPALTPLGGFGPLGTLVPEPTSLSLLSLSTLLLLRRSKRS